MQYFMQKSRLPYCFVYLAPYIGRIQANAAPQQLIVNKELTMKFDFAFRPAAEIPAAEALRPVRVNELTVPMPAVRRTEADFAPSQISLLARRQARQYRRATR
ncbi:MAG TPA: hypothetical protein PKY73_04935 [Hyphomonas sp.]|nr:hypothetical protein [Hyphomonas sp.]